MSLRLFASLAGALLLPLAVASGAQAAQEEPQPFCQGEAVHDFLAPLQQMPKLHSPPENGRIGFGPKSVKLSPTPALLVGQGSIGYSLSLHWRAPSAHPRWNVTTTLSAVDWRGRTTGIVDRLRQRIVTISRKHNVEINFEVGGRPAAYRLTFVFRSDSGRKLGGYGFYSRVVRPTKHARLTLDSNSYGPEATLFGRIENFGTVSVFYGAEYVIERLEGMAWVKAPESPSIFILPLYWSKPGSSGPCLGFRVRPSMSGRYRMSKQVEYGDWPPPRDRRPVTLTAEFDVLP
jgi:Big-like domain-containing protein